MNDSYQNNLKVSQKAYLNIRWLIECFFIIAFMPLILLLIFCISVLLILDGKYNPFFLQCRMGKNRKTFLLFKFRTIKNSTDRFVFDPERIKTITPLCRFLRVHRLDEIPQVFNVLLGQMSLIGPRPDPINQFLEFEKYIDDYKNRVAIMPGLTGLAQVKYGHCTKVDESFKKCEYDIQYINSISPILDLKIIFNTFSTMVNGNGAK